MTRSTLFQVAILQVAALIVLSSLFYLFGGLSLAIIFTIIWIDKSLLPLLKLTGYIGFELTTIPVILVGLIYGPLFGFIFGFLIVALIGGILNIISWRVSPPLGQVVWPPIIPSPDHLIDGFIAALSGLLVSSFQFIVIALSCIIVKNILVAIKDKLILGFLNYPPRIMNIIINFVIVFYLQGYFLAII